ncbi:hypothetical protein E3P99_02290 [Wallemia hederae]|uniref:Uncharacterized protein n=1 Tax=Wallemia hederae TaxID=1540922 RepID=A0A4T0FKS5_9BASI|nr:hypothetical protein E3P99_02290 [Wallemia hederae]
MSEHSSDVNMPSSSSVFGLPNQFNHAIPIPGVSATGGAFAGRRGSNMAQTQSQHSQHSLSQSPTAFRRASLPSTPPSVDMLMDEAPQAYASAHAAQLLPSSMQAQMQSTYSQTPAKVPVRPVQRRQNLLPKSKNFSRVQDQLRTEKAPQQNEVMSEANVQRLLQSAPSSPLIPRTPRSKWRARRGGRESYSFSLDDDEQVAVVSSSSGESDADEHEHDYIPMGGEDMEMTTSDPSETNSSSTVGVGGSGGAGLSQNATNTNHTAPTTTANTAMRPPAPPQRQPHNTSFNAWLDFREPGTSTKASPGSGALRLSQGNIFDVDATMSGSPGMGVGVNQTPHLSGKAPKRKLTDTDRYEPYAYTSMKRRAVSPSLSLSGSPSMSAATPTATATAAAAAAAAAAQTPSHHHHTHTHTHTHSQPSFSKSKRRNSSHHTSRSSSPQLSSVVAAASTPGKGSGMGYGTTALGLAASSGVKWGNDQLGGGADSESALETGSSYTSEEAVKGRSEGVDGISRMTLG